jgi:hypothetical protein
VKEMKQPVNASECLFTQISVYLQKARKTRFVAAAGFNPMSAGCVHGGPFLIGESLTCG